MHCVNFDFLAGVARRGERVIGAYSYGGAVSFSRAGRRNALLSLGRERRGLRPSAVDGT